MKYGVNGRTCPINVSVSIALTSLNLPGGQFYWPLNTGRLGRSAAAGLSQPGPWPLARAVPLNSDILSRGTEAAGQQAASAAVTKTGGWTTSLPAAAVKPAKQLEVQLELASDSEVPVQVYWHVDPNLFEFQRAGTNFEVKVLKSRGYKFETLPLHVHGQPGARQRHVPVTWSRTGCQPDLELSSRRYSILFGTAARRRCPVLATNWGGLCGAWSRAQRRTQP